MIPPSLPFEAMAAAGALLILVMFSMLMSKIDAIYKIQKAILEILANHKSHETLLAALKELQERHQ